MTVKDLIEQVTNICCSGLHQGEDEKPTKIYGNPNKKNNKVSEEPKKEEPKLEEKTTEESHTASKNASFSGKDTKYLDYTWEKLPKDAREAATSLGYDKDSWDPPGWPESQDKWFEELTEEERKAAITLGWDITSWDNKYEELNWADIPDQVKHAAEILGFDQHMWDHDHWPEFEHKSYDELTKEEKRCVNVLGYNKHDWDE